MRAGGLRTRALFALVIAGLLVFAVQETSAQPMGAFARLGFGARGMAMSNALVADGFGSASPFYNPALAPLVEGQYADAAFGLLSHDRSLQHLQLAVPLRPQAGFTAGLIHAGVSDIDGRDASGYHTRTYSTDEYAFHFAFGLRFGSRVAAGLGLRLYRSDLFPDVDAVNALGLGFGLLVRPIEPLFVGVAVDDLLAKYDWDTSGAFGEDGRQTTDRFPVRLRAGAALRVADGNATIAVEYESLVDPVERVIREVTVVEGVPGVVDRYEGLSLHDSRVRLGGEWWISPIIAVRAGVDRIGVDAFAGVTPSAGFGISHDLGELGLQIDYTFTLEPYVTGTMNVVGLHLNL